MRRAIRSNQARNRVARPYTLPSPVGGWVSNRAISDMKPDQAVLMRNWFPHTDAVGIRKGYISHALTEVAGAVETVMSYKSGTVSKLFAAASGDIFDVTLGDNSTPDLSGKTNDRWNWVNFATSGGQYLIATNGIDLPIAYNGSWSEPVISGVSPDTFLAPVPYRERLYFVQTDTANVFYLPVDSIAGAASTLALGGYLTLGGSIIAGSTWTPDAGIGPDDYVVFVSSEGELLVFEGSDPSVPANWNFRGRFRIGRPIGHRCLMRVGGELNILCSDGINQLTRIFVRNRTSKNETTLSWNIFTSFNEAYSRWATNYGWQMFNYPEANMIIVNIPTSEGALAEQYVMNTLNGSWCQFTNINAQNWTALDGKIYFGGVDGEVFEANTTSLDDGNAIPADLVYSFGDWGARGFYKQAGLVRPIISGQASLIPAVIVLADYNIKTASVPQSLDQSSGTNPLWDVALWDVALWPFLDGGIATNWGSGTNGGHELAVGISVAFKSIGNESVEYDFRLNEVNCTYERGGLV